MLLAIIPPLSANAESPETPSIDFTINGAGATFPFANRLWRVEYNKEFSNIHLNYQSIGSGGGIKQQHSLEKIVNNDTLQHLMLQ